ncbi:hypothetical protein [Haloterrigena turkmenica]|nr:hypothetical protein [Haloterrigena turkmenica]
MSVEEESFQVLPNRLEGDRYLDDLLENHERQVAKERISAIRTMKSYLIPEGTTTNLKTAFHISPDERNKHHKRAKWMASISLICMLTVLGVPIGIPLFIWAMREANKAEEEREK